ncbi:MAG: helix-turn-helix transcriptional regulator [Panacagrimonas sp.]
MNDMASFGGSAPDDAAPLLRCVVQALSAQQAHLYSVDEHTGDFRVLSSEPAAASWPILIGRAAPDDVELPSSVPPAEDASPAEALADALRPQDSSHRLRALLWQDFHEYAFIDVRRSDDQEAFKDSDRVVLDSLMPSLRLALRPASGPNLADQIFENLPFGVGLLDAQCRLRMPNQMLRRILREADGLLIENGQLRPCSEADQLALLRALGQDPEGAPPSGEMLIVSRINGRAPYLLVLEKFDGPSHGDSIPLFKLLVSDPLDLSMDSVRLAARRFCLTSMETEVIHSFLSGNDMDQCARQFGISPHTLRWHTKRIMAKTRTASRTAMVQLFGRAVLLYTAAR